MAQTANNNIVKYYIGQAYKNKAKKTLSVKEEETQIKIWRLEQNCRNLGYKLEEEKEDRERDRIMMMGY